MKKAEVFWIKYIDYFDNGRPGEHVYTYSSPNFIDIYAFYEVMVSDGVDSTGYLVTDTSDAFKQRIEQINNL